VTSPLLSHVLCGECPTVASAISSRKASALGTEPRQAGTNSRIADAALTGFELEWLYKPSNKCVRVAGEFFARFGRKDGIPEDLKTRTAGIGALFGIAA